MKKFLIILGVVAAIGLTACQGLEKLFAVTDEKIANVATSRKTLHRLWQL